MIALPGVLLLLLARVEDRVINFPLLALFDEESDCRDTKKLAINLESSATNRPKQLHHTDDPTLLIITKRLDCSLTFPASFITCFSA